MSSSIEFRRITPEDFDRSHNDTAYAEAYFGFDLNADDDEVLLSFFESLEASDLYLDLGKKWQGIHFLLTGEFPSTHKSSLHTPLHKVMMGGAETPLCHVVGGVIRYFSVDEVREIAQALSNVSGSELELRLSTLMEHDKHKWDTTPSLLSLCIQLVKFFNKAAQNQDIVLLSVIV